MIDMHWSSSISSSISSSSSTSTSSSSSSSSSSRSSSSSDSQKSGLVPTLSFTRYIKRRYDVSLWWCEQVILERVQSGYSVQVSEAGTIWGIASALMNQGLRDGDQGRWGAMVLAQCRGLFLMLFIRSLWW